MTKKAVQCKFDAQSVWSEGYDNGNELARMAIDEGEPLDESPIRDRRDWANGLPMYLMELAVDAEQLELLEEQFIKGCEARWRDGKQRRASAK